MKNYRTEIIAIGFLAGLMLSILLITLLKEPPTDSEPGFDILPTVTTTASEPGLEVLPTATITASVESSEQGGTYPPSATSNTPVSQTGNEGTFPTCVSGIELICMVSVGTDTMSGETVFGLQTPNPVLSADLYLFVTSRFGNTYECQPTQTNPKLVYCYGVYIPSGTTVQIDVYTLSEDRLVASGTFVMPAEQPFDPKDVDPSYPSYP